MAEDKKLDMINEDELSEVAGGRIRIVKNTSDKMPGGSTKDIRNDGFATPGHDATRAMKIDTH